MSYREKLMFALFPLAFCVTATFADTVQTEVFKLNASVPWKLPYKAITLQLTAKISSEIDWFVNPEVETRNGEVFPADTVQMDCDGKMFKIPANSHQVCKLDAGHTMRIYIAREDYAHGSSGTWEASLP